MIESVEIDAPADLVWQLLREEASQGEALGQAVALSEIPGRELLIEVRMGFGFSVQHAYRIERLGERCRISDQLRPLGWRWRLSNVFLFGRGLRPLEAAAAQGLRNLRETAETAGREDSSGNRT